jgi:rhamnogalacturonan endolyase
MRTGDGTVDGVGRVLGNGSADHRNSFGHILQGPEYLTVFSGYTGEALATVDFAPPRGSVEDWGDKAGNRSDRFLAAIAYLDGERPSLVMTRGYYNQTQLAAYDYRNGSLSKRWLFKADANVHPLYRGQGNHHLNVADVDMDGKDEIVFGAMVIDDDGSGLYSTAWGHGDALHTADVDPNRPGLEICQVHEKSRPLTLTCRDAATGQELWSVSKEGLDSGRCVVADIDPRYPGQEVWARYLPGLYSATGEMIAEMPPPTYNFGIWWDGDLLRELLDNITIYKWDHDAGGGGGGGQLREIMTAHGTNTNSQKATPSLQADLLGDWREEVVWRTVDSTALRIYTTTHETTHRIPTLMHDHQYRMSIAWQNVGYNQMPHPSYYLGSSTT